jgi:hypothetical protein
MQKPRRFCFLASWPWFVDAKILSSQKDWPGIDCIALVFSWLSKVKWLAESGGRPPKLLKVRKAASDTKDSGAAGKNNELERS